MVENSTPYNSIDQINMHATKNSHLRLRENGTETTDTTVEGYHMYTKRI
jgi:predicted GNAT family N-acyltransferase